MHSNHLTLWLIQRFPSKIYQMTNIIDQEESIGPFEKYRSSALALEFLPLIVGLFGILLKIPLLATIGFSIGAIVYPLFSWYLFKTSNYQFLDIFFATLFGFGLFVSIIGFLFYFQKWEGTRVLLRATHQTLILGFGFSILQFLLRIRLLKNKEQEFRMSLKILSRYAVLLFIFYYLNLDEFIEPVLREI